jgi:hypothetical protein
MGHHIVNLPPQQLPFNKKTKEWRKKHLDWADGKTFFNHDLVRKSVIHKRINYDLLDGKLHMNDLLQIMNPHNTDADFITNSIQHYHIMNSKLNVIRGEERKRNFDYKVVITNPNAISEIEETKKQEIFSRLQELLANTAQSEEEFEQELEKLNSYYMYEYQDFREIRANSLLNHYVKELNIPLIFNQGFMDAMAVGEEIYQCDIVGGEPTIERLDPLKVRVFKSGYSNKIEDAEIIVIEDYWSPSKVIDTFYDVLTKKDRESLEKGCDTAGGSVDEMDNIDDRMGFVHRSMVDDTFESSEYLFDPFGEDVDSLAPYDMHGNVRVIKMYWKSRRKIKKVKSYDVTTGEETFNFYPETYVINENLGEEEQIFYINEAWEGTKIGKDIYVNMRPRPIQYNRLSNPSRCHFGIIGSVYNLNNSKPFSLVDMMKPYNYLYDVIHDRLNKLIAKNWGKIITLDLAKTPKDWDVEKWLYFAKTNSIAVIDSFKEGNIGAATGKLAGGLNNASSGVIDAELGNSIQHHINLLEFIKMEMSEVAGISKQREGQISNRETVGGVERATLQSSHITEWLFIIHDDVKRRVLECFLETAKIALKGRSKKFQYLMSDFSMQIVNIDGDEFADADYGLLVDDSPGIQDLNAKLDMLAQAALQNQTLNFSTIMKLYSSSSLAEKQRMVEKNEMELMQRQQQMQQQQMQMEQQKSQMEAQMKQAEMEQKDALNMRDNETKILIAQISAASNQVDDCIQEPVYSEEAKANLAEKIREFDAKLKLEREKFESDKKSKEKELEIRRIQANKKPTSKK